MKKRAKFPFTTEQMELLIAFEQCGSLSKLALLLAKDPSVISRNLQRLAEVAPVIVKVDGRWQISPLGRETCKRAAAFHDDLNAILKDQQDVPPQKGISLTKASTFMHDDYIQHNPNVATGLQGFLDYFRRLGPPRDIPAEIPGLVTIRAEGDLVILAFVDKRSNPAGGTYTTTWFDMFRIQGRKIAEHWDCAPLSAVP